MKIYCPRQAAKTEQLTPNSCLCTVKGHGGYLGLLQNLPEYCLSGLRALCSSFLPLWHPVPVGSCRLWGMLHPNGGDIVKHLYTLSLLSISWNGIVKGEFSSYPALWPLIARSMYSWLSDTLAGGTLIDTWQGIQERSKKTTVISCGQGMSEPSSW